MPRRQPMLDQVHVQLLPVALITPVREQLLLTVIDAISDDWYFDFCHVDNFACLPLGDPDGPSADLTAAMKDELRGALELYKLNRQSRRAGIVSVPAQLELGFVLTAAAYYAGLHREPEIYRAYYLLSQCETLMDRLVAWARKDYAAGLVPAHQWEGKPLEGWQPPT